MFMKSTYGGRTHVGIRAMKHIFLLLAAVATLPLSTAAQQDPIERLSQVLPAEMAEQVLARVEDAREMSLPTQAVANLALEGVAKGRSAAEVLAAVELLVADMGRALEAMQSARHDPGAGEIEAATAALRMGVDGAAVAELARSAPSGRSLAVPLLVLGGLAQRGLPSEEALTALSERLAARAPDAELLAAFGAPGGRGLGVGPGGTVPNVAGGRGAPAAGVTVPAGPPDGAGRPPDGRGRSGGAPQI